MVVEWWWWEDSGGWMLVVGRWWWLDVGGGKIVVVGCWWCWCLWLYVKTMIIENRGKFMQIPVVLIIEVLHLRIKEYSLFNNIMLFITLYL